MLPYKTVADSSSGAKKAASLVAAVLKSIDDSKAEDVVVLDVSERTSIADYMIVASGRSHRHVGAIADRLQHDLKDQGFGTIQLEGVPVCDWVLADCGDVIVHLFRPEVRGFYNLEKIWAADPVKPTVRT